MLDDATEGGLVINRQFIFHFIFGKQVIFCQFLFGEFKEESLLLEVCIPLR